MIHVPGRSVTDGSGSTTGPESPGARRPAAKAGNGRPPNPLSNGRAPAPAPELELLGSYAGSGHRRPPSLVRRADGQIVQLTPVLYRVLEEIDGQRSYESIASTVGSNVGKGLSAEDVRFLVEKKLRPLGLLEQADGSAPVVKKANPLLALGLRKIITRPETTQRITAPFTKLFLPPIVVAVVAGFLLTTGWLLFGKGLAAPTRHALYEPGLLLLVFALTTLSAGFHELGHAAACRYGGATPGAMGVGFYLVWPAFYTDVSDSYRLDRRARLRVDLGGLYFNAIFSVAAFLMWLALGWDALLVVIPLQLLQMLRQLIPLVRLDGYHILADLTGVPDLFAHIKPILLGLLPTRWGRPENKILRRRVKFIVTAWVALVLPILLFTLVIIVVMFPRLAATAWDSLGLQWQTLQVEWSDGDPVAIAARVLSIVALAIPVLGIAYLLTRIVRRTGRRVWRGTTDRPVMRGIAVLVATALVALVGLAWWPDGQYQPIGQNASGLPVDVRFRELPVVERLLSSERDLSEQGGAPMERSPIEPLEAAAAGSGDGNAAPVIAATPEASPSPEFAFTAPPEPGEGDNQAVAINDKDGSTIVDLAFSLLFLSEDTIDNGNEAWALATCSNCGAVAVAFQVLLILDRADVVVPENVAVAVNAYCNNCVTQALAMQLIVTLSEPLDDEAMAELERIAARLEKLEDSMADMPLDEIHAELQAIQTEILNLLVAEGAVAEQSTETAETALETGEASPLPSPTPTARISPTPSPKTSPQPSSQPSPSTSPEPSPSPSGEPSPSPSGQPSPTPTSGP